MRDDASQDRDLTDPGDAVGRTPSTTWRVLADRLGVRSIARRRDVGDRAVVLALFGRFVDELASGLPLVLMPTLRQRLGLSIGQVGWCIQVLYGAAAVVEPVTSAAIDVVRRRPLLVWGAAGWAVSLLMVAGAPTYGWLLAAFVVAGVSSGPLAHTTDVLLVEMHPGGEERIGARQTMLDTSGALLAPTTVAVVGWAGGDPRLPLVVVGLAIVAYAVLLGLTPMPDPSGGVTGPGTTIRATAPRRPAGAPADGGPQAERADAGERGEPGRRPGGLAQVRAGFAPVLADRDARIWLLALFGDTLAEIPALFQPVWLGGDVGASQPMVAVHAAVELAASLVGLALLDRWLRHHEPRVILNVALAANTLLYPVWLLVPGIGAKIALAVPLAVAIAPVWPLVRARALAAVPGRGGAVMAITSLYGALPLAGVFGWIGSRVGLAPTMFVVHTVAALGILLAVRRGASGDPTSDRPA